MTTPHGYPDWGRYQAVADVIHVQNENVTLVAADSTVLGGFPTFGARALYIEALSNTNRARITVNWSTDNSLGNAFVTDQMVVGPGGVARVAFPVRAAFALIQVSAPVALGTSVNITIANTSQSGPPQSTSGANILASVTGGAVAAGGTSTTLPPQVWVGDSHWHVSSALAAWTARLMVTDTEGANTIICLWGAGQTIPLVRPLLPAMPLRLEFTNSTGGAGTYNMYLVGHPISGDF